MKRAQYEWKLFCALSTRSMGKLCVAAVVQCVEPGRGYRIQPSVCLNNHTQTSTSPHSGTEYRIVFPALTSHPHHTWAWWILQHIQLFPASCQLCLILIFLPAPQRRCVLSIYNLTPGMGTSHTMCIPRYCGINSRGLRIRWIFAPTLFMPRQRPLASLLGTEAAEVRVELHLSVSSLSGTRALGSRELAGRDTDVQKRQWTTHSSCWRWLRTKCRR